MSLSPLLITIFNTSADLDKNKIKHLLKILLIPGKFKNDPDTLTKLISELSSIETSRAFTRLVEALQHAFPDDTNSFQAGNLYYDEIQSTHEAYAIKDIYEVIVQEQNNDNERELNAVINALGHPEHLDGMTFIPKNIKNIKSTKLTKELTAIYDLLLKHFKTDNTHYNSGNIFYEAIQNLIRDLPFLKDRAHVQTINNVCHTIYADMKKIKSINTSLNTGINRLIQDYQLLKENCTKALSLDIVRKQIIKADLNQEATFHLAQLYKNIIDHVYIVYTLIISTYKAQNNDIVEPQFGKISAIIDEIDSQHKHTIKTIHAIDPDTANLLDITHEQCKEAHLTILVKEHLHKQAPPKKQTKRDKKIIKNAAESNYLVDSITTAERLFTDEEADPDLLRAIKPEDRTMYAHLDLTRPITNPYLQVNPGFFMTLGLFDQAHALEVKKQDEAFAEYKTTEEVRKAYCAFNLIEKFCGKSLGGQDFTRELNFLHFINNTLIQLGQIPTGDILSDPALASEFTFLLEKTLIQLWKTGNGEIKPQSIYVCNAFILISPENYSYYYEVIKQKHLIFAAMILEQLLRLNTFYFQNINHYQDISNYLTPEENAALYINSLFLKQNPLIMMGHYGIYDILFHKIRERQIALFPIMPLQLCDGTPNYEEEQKKKQEEADKAFLELIAEEDEIERLKQEAIDAEYNKIKEEESKKEAPSYSTNLKLFDNKTPSEDAQTKPTLSLEEIAYHVIREARRNTPMHILIGQYTAIVSDYLKNPYDTNPKADYFYIAASLVEVATCHTLQGNQLTHKHFVKNQEEPNAMLRILKSYKSAVTFANHAKQCFTTHVSILPEATQNQFTSLAKNIDITLQTAKNDLEFISKKAQAKKDHAKQIFEKIHAKKQEQIKAAGGILAWLKTQPAKPHKSDDEKRYKMSLYAERKLWTETNVMAQNFLDNNLFKIANVFAYLAGKTALPLLAEAKSEITSTSQPALLGAGLFSDRLALVTQTERLLKSGYNQTQVLQQLLPSSDIIDTEAKNNAPTRELLRIK